MLGYTFRMSFVYGMLHQVGEKKWLYLSAFLSVFFLTLSVLVLLGLAPTFVMGPASRIGLVGTEVPAPSTSAPQNGIDAPFENGQGESPIGIEIPSVGVKANVSNPSSTDIDVLDEALLKGAVRYPTSAKLGEEGNVLLFGHSSALPVVHNQSFKAFNEIAKLTPGEPVLVYSNGRRYAYAVESVKPADVENDAIPLAVEGSLLTLVTCNSFGDKSDRYIVTARLVDVTVGERSE